MKWWIVGLLAVLALAAFAQEELSRVVKMRQVEDWIGNWKLEGKLLEPPELSDVTFAGKMTAKWTLQKTALEFRAEAMPHAHDGVTRPMEALGILAYDDEQNKYTSFFAMGNDGRMISLQGNLKNKVLVLDGKSPNSEHFDVRVKVGAGDVRKVDVYAVDGKREQRFLELTLTREK